METITSKIDDRTWVFDEEGVRFFLLAGDEKAILIDSGMFTENARELAEACTDLPIELLCTHADGDHINCNNQFPFAYMHPSECSNYYHGMRPQNGEIRPVWDGDRFDLGGRTLEIIHVPGHTPGSIAILDTEARRLFSGDPVQDGSIFMFDIQREIHSYIFGLKRLESFIDRFDAVYPSHGTCPVSPDMIPALRKAAEDILAGKMTGTDIEIFGKPVTEYDVGIAKFLCDRKA